jgi:hypothetical protein
VTSGPLIFPSVIFGDELKVKPGDSFALGFDLKSVPGIKQAQLISGGAILKSLTFPNAPQEVHVDFPLTTQHAAWYALIVEDSQGRKAYTDPIWVDAVERPAALAAKPEAAGRF